MTVDTVFCGWCHRLIHRTARQVSNGVRFHRGHCAASSRGVLWSEEQLDAHMRKMRVAASRTRTARFHRRLRRVAPHVSIQTAAALWSDGYQAGWVAKRRKRANWKQKQAGSATDG